MKWSPVNQNRHRNKLWFTFAENVITTMRYDQGIPFVVENVDTE